MTELFTVKAGGLQKHYTCGTARVAAKRFLNYLRLHRKERPTHLKIRSESGKEFEADVSWYFGKLKESSIPGPKGEWYRLEEVRGK